ncbi:MAG: methyltransferase [Cereibacter sphaeroides]|uniref:Methyltransferase n=1 Tax=Cereibacter sphaeroides TaxID=1063 RepID=A0A2W5SK01_CERSP|nr:MAG: methyltransferase [Cereibacter sphaeroides]
MPFVDVELRHTEGARLLPSKIELLRHLPKGGRVAEIGVADGDFSAEILRHNQPAVLTLVDAWHTDRYGPGETRVQARFAKEIASGHVVICKGLSLDEMAKMPERSLDWVYIDTDHSYGLTSKELVAGARLVAPEGRICGDDFVVGNVRTGNKYGVIQAVNEFCVTHGWAYEYLTLEGTGYFSFCLKRL